MQPTINESVKEVSWSEINREECEVASLCDMASWAEAN